MSLPGRRTTSGQSCESVVSSRQLVAPLSVWQLTVTCLIFAALRPNRRQAQVANAVLLGLDLGKLGDRRARRRCEHVVAAVGLFLFGFGERRRSSSPSALGAASVFASVLAAVSVFFVASFLARASGPRRLSLASGFGLRRPFSR